MNKIARLYGKKFNVVFADQQITAENPVIFENIDCGEDIILSDDTGQKFFTTIHHIDSMIIC